MLTLLRTIFPRKPSRRYILTALTGAVLVWTLSGNILLSPESARRLSRDLARFADMAEKGKTVKSEQNIFEGVLAVLAGLLMLVLGVWTRIDVLTIAGALLTLSSLVAVGVSTYQNKVTK